MMLKSSVAFAGCMFVVHLEQEMGTELQQCTRHKLCVSSTDAVSFNLNTFPLWVSKEDKIMG